MQRISTYIDNNFLDGQLKIVVDSNRKLTIGKLMVYDVGVDNVIVFTAISKCHKDDEFNEEVGVELTKLKLVKKYYSRRKQLASSTIEYANKLIKASTKEYNIACKKLNNVKSFLTNKYDLTFYNVDKTSTTNDNVEDSVKSDAKSSDKKKSDDKKKSSNKKKKSNKNVSGKSDKKKSD